MLFSRSSKNASRKTKKNITLTVNEVLQKADTSSHIRVIRAEYSTTETISVLLREKTNADMLLSIYKNSLIRAMKEVNAKITEVHAIKQ